MEPPRPGTQREAKEAREAIAEDALAYLEEVKAGVESPIFATYTSQDRNIAEAVAVRRVREASYDRPGIFLKEPEIRLFHQEEEFQEIQAASFAYLAAGYMDQIRTPFYQVNLRTRVSAPRDLGEFVGTMKTVSWVTDQVRGEHFDEVARNIGWRTANAFWEASRKLYLMLRSPGQDTYTP